MADPTAKGITRRRVLGALSVGGLGWGLFGGAPRQAYRDLPEDAPAPYRGLVRSLPEEHDDRPRIEGRIPEGLRGTLYRNGPGLFRRGARTQRHVFDGDGMVQSFVFDDRGVRYRNRFIRTAKFAREEAAGRFLYATLGTQAPGGTLTNLMGLTLGHPTAITVMPRAGVLYAFDEGTTPMALDPESLATRGPDRLGFPSAEAVFNAHSKVDPRTGDWLLFGVDYGPENRLLLSLIRDGRPASSRAYNLPEAFLLHDFWFTERHIVVALHPFICKAEWFLLGRESVASTLAWWPHLGTRLWVLPREGPGEPVEIADDPWVMLHAVNAFEEGGAIVADGVVYDDPSAVFGPNQDLDNLLHGRVVPTRSPGRLTRLHLDLTTRRVRRERLGLDDCEMPTLPLHRLGQRHDTAFFLTRARDRLAFDQVACVDFAGGKTARFGLGGDVWLDEPVFAPAPGAPDRGWLLVEGHDGQSGRAMLLVLDREHVDAGPLAVVHLEHHVPLSLHGAFRPRG